jgi:Phage integrase, N-terminal SAM-like domain
MILPRVLVYRFGDSCSLPRPRPILLATMALQVNADFRHPPAPDLRREARESNLDSPRPPKLLDRVREANRLRHGSRSTEKSYVGWIRRYILFHGKRHPAEMGAPEVSRFLSSLAVEGRVKICRGSKTWFEPGDQSMRPAENAAHPRGPAANALAPSRQLLECRSRPGHNDRRCPSRSSGRSLRARKTTSGRSIVAGRDGWCSSSHRETDGA